MPLVHPDRGQQVGLRPPALFLGDAAGLDFLNTLATPVDVPVDWISDGDGLLRWLEQARMVPSHVLQDIRATVKDSELDRVAAQARSLREWFRTFVRQRQGRSLTPRDFKALEPLNRLLECDESFRQIQPSEAGGPPFQLARRRRWRNPDALLIPIAEALAELVCTEDFAQVKACEGPTCTLLFVDRTRGHQRRWCSMAICGNRAKQAAHRRRRSAHDHRPAGT